MNDKEFHRFAKHIKKCREQLKNGEIDYEEYKKLREEIIRRLEADEPFPEDPEDPDTDFDEDIGILTDNAFDYKKCFNDLRQNPPQERIKMKKHRRKPKKR